MLAELGQQLAEELQAFTVAGKLLEGIDLVRWVDIDVPAHRHPCITVDLEAGIGVRKEANRIELTVPFAVTLYTLSLKGEIEAEQAHQNLVMRYDAGTDKFLGVLPALSILGRWKDVHENVWTVTYDERPRVVLEGRAGRHKTWTIGQTFVVRFTRWVEPSTFRP